MMFVPGLSVRVLTHEGAQVQVKHQSVMRAIVALAQREGLAGITVIRAVEGYSAHGGIRTASWADIADDLPLTIEIVDRRERVEPLLPELAALVPGSALTVTEVRLFVSDGE